MKTSEIVRAWKDEDYRGTLTAEIRAELPEHPAGVIEFDKPELEDETLFTGGKISASACKTAHPCGQTHNCTSKIAI